MSKHTAPHALVDSGDTLVVVPDLLVGWNIHKMCRPEGDSDVSIFGTTSFTFEDESGVTDTEIAERIRRTPKQGFFEGPRQVLGYIGRQIRNGEEENLLVIDGVNLFYTYVPRFDTERVISVVWDAWDTHRLKWYADAAIIGSIPRIGKVHVCCRIVER